MATAVEVPPELQDIIIDHMHGQKQVLGTCGLVSKAWLRSSRHHLFGSVTLHQQNWPDFLCLAQSPLATFAGSINSLDLQIGDDADFNKLAAGLPPFPGVRRLRLSGVYLSNSFALTDHSLLALFHNITELDIYFSTFATPYQLALLASHFPCLQRLSVDPMFLENDVVPLAPAVPRNLQFMCFRSAAGNENSTSSFLSWLHAAERPPSIRVLEMSMLGTESLPAASALIRALGADLEALNLKLVYRVTAADISKHIDFSRNTRLQRLTIHMSLRRFLSPAAHAGGARAPWALLSALHAKITTLTIVLALDTVDLIDNLDWAFLSTALRTHPPLSALQQLHFIVHCSVAMDEVEGAIRARLPEESARGLVEVEGVDTSRTHRG
ncbi:hypothetical protein C8R44DRAFT_751099 [Mycena epipterygia]|nr:hypothetical protein C8R44DRAFT_751099 [Mycena epipterygia]